MQTFKSLDDLINAKALQTLKAFAYDQPEAIDWTIAGLKKEIIKERDYVARTKVHRLHDAYSSMKAGVPAHTHYISNFGYVA